jgi:hypothetical protein
MGGRGLCAGRVILERLCGIVAISEEIDRDKNSSLKKRILSTLSLNITLYSNAWEPHCSSAFTKWVRSVQVIQC